MVYGLDVLVGLRVVATRAREFSAELDPQTRLAAAEALKAALEERELDQALVQPDRFAAFVEFLADVTMQSSPLAGKIFVVQTPRQPVQISICILMIKHH